MITGSVLVRELDVRDETRQGWRPFSMLTTGFLAVSWEPTSSL